MASPAANEKQKPQPSSSPKTANSSSGNTYISGGQVLASPPLTARINSAITTLYNVAGLYVTTLFSLDPYNAAMNSRFNTRGPGRNTMPSGGRALGGNTGNGGSSGWFGWGSGGGGSNGGSGGSRPAGRRFGTVNDVRGPECGSCQ